MAKKVLYRRIMESQRNYWPATFEDISDDERDVLIRSPIVTDHYHCAIDFSIKKEELSPESYLAPALKFECVDRSFAESRAKEVPFNLKIKPESTEILVDEYDLIIDTAVDEDEKLLQEWNENPELEMKNEEKDDVMTPMKLGPQYTSPYCQTQSIEQFNCNFCTRKYWKPSKLKDHLKSHHFGKKLVKKNHYDDKRDIVSKGSQLNATFSRVFFKAFQKCPDCKKQLQTKTDMYVHRLTHRNPAFAQISCILCKKNQFTYGALKTHVREKHGIKEKWFCPICPEMRTFTQNHSLLIHISTFHFDANKQPPAQYPCDKCQRTFTSRALLGKHLNNEHLSPSYNLKHYKMFKCEYCQDFFQDLVTLEEHSPCFEEKKNRNIFTENNSDENLVFNTQKRLPLNGKRVTSHSPFTISSILTHA